LPSVPKLRPSLAEAIDIPLWLERDRETPWADRAHRDRTIGREFATRSSSPVERVMHWWQVIAPDPIESEPGKGLARLLRRLAPIMIGAGALSGTGLAAAVLRYDGSDPINILMAFGLLVMLPMMFLIVSLALPLWSSSSVGGETNLGHIVLGFLKRKHPAFDEFFAAHHADQARDRLLRWRFMLSSQQFGFAFSVAALATLMVKAGFSDLAFAWSTTLTIEAHHVHDAVVVIARPWSFWVPGAVPDLSLIEHSRYFRLKTDPGELSAAALTAWWRFLALSIFSYGVVPRACALVVALLRVGAAERTLLLAHPEVRALLDRLESPEIASTSMSAESPAAAPEARASMFDGIAAGDVIIIWNGAAATGQPSADAIVIEAGGERTPDDDREALSRIPPDVKGVVRVITKAWEPPLLELHDYLSALRQHVGRERSIVVQPLGEAQASPDPNDVAVWRASLSGLDDPAVYVQ